MSNKKNSKNKPTTSGAVSVTGKNKKNLTAQGYMPACVADVITFTMGVFFDGTGNNKYNTDNPRNTDDSYGNSYSNVARTWEFYKGKKNDVDLNGDGKEGENFNIYVEGIGTNKGKEDDKWVGQGLGTHFRSGVKPRVRLASKQVLKKIIEEIDEKVKVVEITFDLFGFSRGAAAARHFISLNSYYKSNLSEEFDSYIEYRYEVYKKRKKIDRKLEFKIKWNFLGLYETVSSHGFNHNDDIEELGLMDIKNVNGIFQIVAENEYRENFSLTPVGFYGTSITIPGAHSDIGGGYSEFLGAGKLHEDNRTIYRCSYRKVEKIKKLRDKLSDEEGWFEKTKDKLNFLKIKEVISRKDNKILSYKLVASREKIKNTYSYIAMYLMVEEAIKYGVKFDYNGVKNKYPLIPKEDDKLGLVKKGDTFLKEIYEDIKRGNGITDPAKLKKLRYNYLHWSARYNGIGHDPRLNKQKSYFERHIIPINDYLS